MNDYFYAQLDTNNICIGVSQLKSEVPEYNFAERVNFNPLTDETIIDQVFASRMIKIPIYSSNYIGLKYTEDGKWEQVITQ